MAWIDIAAAVAAQRHSGGTVVTASIDSLQFVHPVRQGDVVVLRASVNRAWRSSMEAGVRVACETPGDPQNARHAASAYLTFVALDDGGQPRAVPAVQPKTSDERRRFRAAAGRRAQRLDRR
jgi:acyl-CoA hydrolase